MSSTAARRRVTRSLAVAASLLVAGCGPQVSTHGGLTEGDARVQVQTVAARAFEDRGGELEGVRLTVAGLRMQSTASGDEYWEATLVDAGGVPRLCVRVRGGLSGTTNTRRCDPEGADPPVAPGHGEDVGPTA